MTSPISPYSSNDRFHKRPSEEQSTQLSKRQKDVENSIEGSFCVTSLSCVMPFLTVEEFFGLSLISCTFKNAITQISGMPGFWEGMFEREGIPRVLQNGDRKRNPGEDFIHLYQRTCVSGKMINTYLGEMVGRIPAITAEVFERSKGEPNFGFFVRPDAVRRTIGPDFPMQLVQMRVQSYNLMQPERYEQLLYPNKDLIGEGEVITIPFGIFNLRVLSNYPKTGKEHAPCLAVDKIDEEFFTEAYYEAVGGTDLDNRDQIAFHLFNHVSGNVKVDYMLKWGILEESRWVADWDREHDLGPEHQGEGTFIGIEEQQNLLEGQGFKLAGVLPIALREVIRKLQTGVSSLADFSDEFYFHNHRLRSHCGVWQNVEIALAHGGWLPTIAHLGALPDASQLPPGTDRERSLIEDLFYRSRGHATVTRAYTHECIQALQGRFSRFGAEDIWRGGLVIGPGGSGTGISIETSEDQFQWGDIGSVPRLRAEVRVLSESVE